MDIFNLMKNFGIVLSIALIFNMLNDLNNSADKLSEAATELNAATTTMNQNNQKLLNLFEEDPTVALNYLNKNNFNSNEFENLTALNKIEAKKYINDTAAAIENEIVKETIIETTVNNVNTELEILNEEIKKEII